VQHEAEQVGHDHADGPPVANGDADEVEQPVGALDLTSYGVCLDDRTDAEQRRRRETRDQSPDEAGVHR
jgi:hypothetical protein